ncbi:threonine/serine exporter family protein [Oerskovia sp. M15]
MTVEASDEPGLEPSELVRQSGAVLRVGRLALSAGTGSYRVKSHMTRVGQALGLDRTAAHVTLTEITATSYRDRNFRTEVAEVRAVGINSDRLSELESYVSELPEQITAAEVDAGLDRIAASRSSTAASSTRCGQVSRVRRSRS